MELTKKKVRGAVVAEIHGKLIGGPQNSEEFHAFFKSLLDDGGNKIVINLRDTPWANSQGIGMLIGAYTSVKNAGGQLVLAQAVDRIKDILLVTKLFLLFKTFDSENDAIDYLMEKT